MSALSFTSSTTSLSRKAFGIDAWPSVIGDAVDLRIEAEAVRTRADGSDDDATESHDAASVPAATSADTPSDSDTDSTP